MDVAKELTYDVGVVSYLYPGAASTLNYDFHEFYGSLSGAFGPASTTVSYNYSPDYFGGSGTASYIHLGLSAPTPMAGLSANAGLGRQIISDNDVFGSPDYTNWTLGLGYDWKNLSFGVTYHDTTLSDPEETAGSDARVVLSLSATQ